MFCDILNVTTYESNLIPIPVAKIICRKNSAGAVRNQQSSEVVESTPAIE